MRVRAKVRKLVEVPLKSVPAPHLEGLIANVTAK